MTAGRAAVRVRAASPIREGSPAAPRGNDQQLENDTRSDTGRRQHKVAFRRKSLTLAQLLRHHRGAVSRTRCAVAACMCMRMRPRRAEDGV